MDVNEIRKYFPVASNCRYFQSAGMSPIPIPVLEKLVSGYMQISNFGDMNWQADYENVVKLYGRVASMCGCDQQDVVFTESNSAAMSYVATALKKKHGERMNIVCMEEEFPSNTIPFEYQGIEMRYVQPKNHRYNFNDICARCSSETVAVVTSHVQYCTGFRQDLETLGAKLKEKGILFIVNTTQGFPFFLPDMKKMNIDVLTCSVHKWGFCSHVGTLFMTTQQFRDKYPTPIAGWLSVDVTGSDDFIHTAKNRPFKVWPTAKQYEFASSDLKGRLGLGYALDFLEEFGFEKLRNHIKEISTYLLESLKKLPVTIISPSDNPDERSAIISFSLENGINQQLVSYLEQKNVIVAMRNGYVRASVNVFTNTEDVDVLCAEVAEFISKTR